MALKLSAAGKMLVNESGKLTCTCCEPPCPQPTVQWDSRSASKSKCGEAENTGFVSTPPKRYTKLVTTKNYTVTVPSGTIYRVLSPGSGVYTILTFIPGTTSYYKRIELVYDKVTCGTTSSEVDTRPGSSMVIADEDTYVCPSAFQYSDTVNKSLPDPGPDCDTSIISATEREGDYPSAPNTYTGYSTAAEACAMSGSVITKDVTSGYLTTCVISEEYTTAELIANTEAALPAFDDDWNDTAGSYRNLTTDELTYSIREGKYRIAYTVPAPGACYRIEWMEGSTPKTWEWNGAGTEGETAYTPEVTIPIPEANETVTVTDVVAYCAGCEE